MNREMPPTQVEIYYDCLADLPTWAVRRAARRCVQESEYPVVPAVGRLRRLALEELLPRETPRQSAARIARERAEGATLARLNHDEVRRILDRHLGRNGDR